MRLLLLAMLAGVGLACAAAPARPADPSPPVSIPRASELEEVLTALQDTIDGVVVADTGTARRSLSRSLSEAQLLRALEQVSLDFDRYWIRRGTTLVLQSRLRDAEDDPFLEVEELRRAAKDWAALVAPFAPRLLGLEAINLKSAFLDSLGPEQSRQAQNGGLPIAQLAPAQRQALLKINAQHSWDDADRELNRARLCFEGWDRLNLVALHPGEAVTQIELPLAGMGGDSVSIAFARTGALRPAPPRAEGAELPVLPGKPPADLEPVWRIPTRKTTLATLAHDLSRQGGPELEVPDYAGARTLWISSTRARRWDVLRAICDLWNWELTGKDGKYRLGRPLFTAARGVPDLYEKMRRAAPPVVWHQARALQLESATERLGRDMEVVLSEIERREGAKWHQVRVASLSPRAQLHLANVVAWRQYATWIRTHGRWDQPQPYTTAPERCLFGLSGPLGPGRHPFAQIAGQDEAGYLRRWGWAVNSSRIVESPRKAQ